MKREDALKLAEDGLNELTEALQQGHSETLKRFLKVAARFPQYSFRNVMLIAFQNPHATYVAGFHAWKKLGRSVMKGEAGIGIIAPMVGRKREDEERAQQNSDDETVFGFRVVHVFDVSQTDGDPLPEIAKIGGEPHDRLPVLEQVIREHGIQLEYGSVPLGAEGASCRGRIIVSDRLSPAKRFAVLVHEFAHEILHQKDREHRPSKTVRETEAEAVAHVVCSAFGIETTAHSADYIQLYDGNADTLAGSLEAIQSTAAKIIMAVADHRQSDRHSYSALAA